MHTHHLLYLLQVLLKVWQGLKRGGPCEWHLLLLLLLRLLCLLLAKATKQRRLWC
jgi:hypothetical protein